ncbi:MAG: hypothetical protein AB7E49_03170 [Campylobacterales bacterium]
MRTWLALMCCGLWALAAQSVPEMKDMVAVDRLIEAIKQAPKPPAPEFKNVFYSAPSGRFVPAVSQKPLTLESIVGNKALISGGWRQAGDAFDGYEVVAVYADYVILKRGDKTMQITMKARATQAILKASDQ